MAQQIKGLVAKPDNWSSIPGAHILKIKVLNVL